MKDGFLNKAYKKVLRTMRKVLPYNYRYRPSGVYETSAQFVQASSDPNARYTPIYPDLVSTLPVPPSLLEALSPYSLYDPISGQTGGPVLSTKNTYGVVEIPNGRLYSDNEVTMAIISPDNKVIGDVSYQHKEGRKVSPWDSALFRQWFFVPPVKYSGTVFNLLTGGGGVSNYFHWIFDVLPRLHLLRQAGLFDKIDWFVVPNYKLSFQKETLDLLGIPARKIIQGTDQLHLQADLLVASSHPRGAKSQILPDWLINFYRDTFLPLASGKTFSPYVYVSRRDSRFRQVTNEKALMNLLHSYGFEIYELSKLSFLEKKDLFASAQVVISASGAGLTHTMFCSAGATLVELFPEGFVNTHYYNMAHICGMHYHFLVSPNPNRANSAKAGQHEHLTVDLEAVRNILDIVLARPSTKIPPLAVRSQAEITAAASSLQKQKKNNQNSDTK
jgi:capsular polysaccharide biosynthesis protein